MPRNTPTRVGEDNINTVRINSIMETPPRAWGRRGNTGPIMDILRNTPTRVGKTRTSPSTFESTKKHPHARGEDGQGMGAADTALETPPRAWGRRIGEPCDSLENGNTPTRVGKTLSLRQKSQATKKHPHARGEDWKTCTISSINKETPPRAWGRHAQDAISTLACRNTPTRVGKTNADVVRHHPSGKHPHARGEDFLGQRRRRNKLETPPRAWGRLDHPDPFT